MDEFIGVTAAARMIGVSPATIRRWVKSGALVSARTPGKHLRFTVSEVNRMLSSETGNIPGVDRNTRDLAAMFETWSVQVQELRPFTERAFDTPESLRAAVEAIRRRRGLLGEIDGLAQEIEDAANSWTRRGDVTTVE
jgi:excisionase family DNA binding protein